MTEAQEPFIGEDSKPMAQTMLARVAQVIRESSGLSPLRSEIIAKRVIEAMGEPTEAMEREFSACDPVYDDPPTRGSTYWRAGIAAALEEKPLPAAALAPLKSAR